MWHLKDSRGQFNAANRDRDLVVSPDVSRLLAGPAPATGRGNYQLLHELAASINVRNNGRDSEQVYFGLAPLTSQLRTAETARGHRWAWVAVTPEYVETLAQVGAVAAGFPFVLSQVESAIGKHGEEKAMNMLVNLRASAFLYLDMAWDEPDLDQAFPEFWSQFRETSRTTQFTQSALLFTFCHEVAHLLQGDGTSRVDHGRRNRQLADCMKTAAKVAWPVGRSHQDEVLADYSAIRLSASANHPRADVADLMFASAVTCAALALDGWNIDRSAVSDTHPSAFLRADFLPAFWIDHLERRKVDPQWCAERRPSPEALRAFAYTWACVRWLGGLYRPGRDGFGVFDDINTLWGQLLTASGYEGFFAFDFDLSSEDQ